MPDSDVPLRRKSTRAWQLPAARSTGPPPPAGRRFQRQLSLQVSHVSIFIILLVVIATTPVHAVLGDHVLLHVLLEAKDGGQGERGGGMNEDSQNRKTPPCQSQTGMGCDELNLVPDPYQNP